MNTTPGYHGRYLRIDLSRRAAGAVPIAPEVLRQYLGGSGLGTWLLLQETRPGQDPLSPAAPVAFVFSPLVGSPLTTSAKFAVMCQSPLSGRINDSLSSSHFAIAGKKTGYDAIVVVGAADRPTALVIDETGVRFEDAAAEWGQSSKDAAARLGQRLGTGYRIAAIGPAGENLVRFATVSHDGRHAGRGGTGAVLGSKKLKALAVRGNRLPEFAHPERLVVASRELSLRSYGPATEKYRELGTVSNLLVFNRLGTLPTRNFQSATFAAAEALAPDTIALDHPRTRASCAACTIGCEHIFYSAGAGGGVRLEYENLFALGPLCGVSDPEIVLQASALCDKLGLDTISAGGTIAFAMECAERGLIDEPLVRFGNGEALLDLLEATAYRRGLGEQLAQGSRRMAAEIGRGAEAFAPQVKGLEIPGYEPRALQTMALGFAVAARGADHNRSGAYQVDFSEAVNRLDPGPKAALLAVETENEAAILDSLILCKFVRGVFDDKFAEMAALLEPVTGWDVSAAELQQTAARIITAKKLFNIHQGWTPAEDTLPDRFFAEELPDGASSGARLSRDRLQQLIADYNSARGWSSAGYPNPRQTAEIYATLSCKTAFEPNSP